MTKKGLFLTHKMEVAGEKKGWLDAKSGHVF